MAASLLTPAVLVWPWLLTPAVLGRWPWLELVAKEGAIVDGNGRQRKLSAVELARIWFCVGIVRAVPNRPR